MCLTCAVVILFVCPYAENAQGFVCLRTANKKISKNVTVDLNNSRHSKPGSIHRGILLCAS